MTKEQEFYKALRDIFVGAKVEGESGYINLMRIKSRYYEKGVFPKLQKDIEQALEPFPEFRGELFDKLYTFFNRYFSESGSIYFRYTPIHQNVYEKVYTDNKDVILFWKTHMLYYVKTDRLFKSLETEIDGFKFFFDVSTLEHKRANEKREIVYEFNERRTDGVLVFNVYYSEKGRKTRVDEILKALRKEGVRVSEDALENAFKVFEKQSEVDYFINKNAREFLKEQFDIWLYQYVFSGESQWTEERIKQLQVLKDTASKIIDFISQFEDELVRIWNKPKFVLNSNYVITLDRLLAASCHCEERSDEAISNTRAIDLIQRILNHPKFPEQVKEWKGLGIVDDAFSPSVILSDFPPAIASRSPEPSEGAAKQSLTPRYNHLPLDTKYFKDLELEILQLFDDLDSALDGWLIKSENYQALNTILPKFNGKVQTIYIDPPFNKEQDADYFYSVKYKDASWITLLENRLQLAKDILKDSGSIFTRCDYNGNMYVRMLMNEVFGEENFRNEIAVRRGAESIAGLSKQFHKIKSVNIIYDNLYWYSRKEEIRFEKILRPATERQQKGYWHGFWKSYNRPNLRYELLGIKLDRGQWLWNKDTAIQATKNYEQYLEEAKKTKETLEEYWERTGWRLRFITKNSDSRSIHSIKYWVPPRKQALSDNNWLDIPGYSAGWEFKTENSEILLKRVIESTSNESDLVVDFFLGSGTTTAVAHKLGRKWLGVEMGEHFYTVVLPRMKKVLAAEKSGISKEVNWQGGGFFKYYELEQYEDALRKVRYEDSDLFDNPYQDPYSQYVFMKDLKMLEALEIDYESNKVKVDLSKLYEQIDVPETLSNLCGKWIKKITPTLVEFEGGETIDTKNLDYKLIKPLIWW